MIAPRAPRPTGSGARRPQAPWLAAVALCALAAACGGRPMPAEIVIGLAVPLSGSDAAAGAAFLRGCERAVGERNTTGGLRLGRTAPRVPVRLDARDDRSETPAAEAVIEDLSRAGAVVLLATPNGVRAIAQVIVAERLGRPLVVHPEISPGVPTRNTRWTVALPAASAGPSSPALGPASPGSMEVRGYATMAATLDAIERAGALDPVTLHGALRSR